MKTTVFFRMIVLVVMTITGVINAELKAQDTNFVTNEVKEGDLVTSNGYLSYGWFALSVI